MCGGKLSLVTVNVFFFKFILFPREVIDAITLGPFRLLRPRNVYFMLQMRCSPSAMVFQRNDTTKMKQVLLLYDTYRIELANHKIDSGFQFHLAAGLFLAHRNNLYLSPGVCQS